MYLSDLTLYLQYCVCQFSSVMALRTSPRTHRLLEFQQDWQQRPTKKHPCLSFQLCIFGITVISDQASINDEPQTYHAHPNVLKMCYHHSAVKFAAIILWSVAFIQWAFVTQIKVIIIENLPTIKYDNKLVHINNFTHLILTYIFKLGFLSCQALSNKRNYMTIIQQLDYSLMKETGKQGIKIMCLGHSRNIKY